MKPLHRVRAITLASRDWSYLDDAHCPARWITGNRTDAEDVVHEACMRAFRAVGGVAEASARAWLLTVVRNTAYTWLRKNRPLTLVPVKNPAETDRCA
jgi:RNA polymerase sigma factor (sigma-70 family)